MALECSFQRRNAIKEYEQKNNSFLLSLIPPSGLLSESELKGTYEALLVPSEAALQRYQLPPFLRVGKGPQNRLSESHSTPSIGMDTGKNFWAVGDANHTAGIAAAASASSFSGSPSLTTLTVSQQASVADILCEHFLPYHLIHFDNDANYSFVSAQGYRGFFSDTLSTVRRLGHSEHIKVLSEGGALLDASDRRVGSCHPAKLQMFIIDTPIMDFTELQALQRRLSAAVGNEENLTGIPVSPGRRAASAGTLSGANLTTTSSPEGQFECVDDVLVDVDLTPYASKTREVTVAHRNVRTHEYSKESIKNYRSVVAADNDIRYNDFVRMMDTPVCARLAHAISRFIQKAENMRTIFTDHNVVSSFLSSQLEGLRKIESIATNPRSFTMMAEGVEKFISTKLYFNIFDVDESEGSTNSILEAKLMSLEHTSAHEIDALAEVEQHHVWGQAMFELDGMNFFKSPREKLRCGVRACELVSLAVGDMLQRRAGGRGAQTPTTTLSFGADEFLPCFMLLVLRARPYHYYQNIRYIDKFRHLSLQSNEESYCLATMLSAVTFWLNEGVTTTHAEGERNDQLGNNNDTRRTSAAAVASDSGKTGSSGLPLTTYTGGANVAAAAVARPPPTVCLEDMLPSLRQASQMQPRGGSAGAGANQSSGVRHDLLNDLFGWQSHRREKGTAPQQQLAISNGTTGQSESADGVTEDTGVVAVSMRRPVVARRGSTTAAAAAGVTPECVMSTSHRVLVVGKKAFEELSIVELREIVEEARNWAQVQR